MENEWFEKLAEAQKAKLSGLEGGTEALIAFCKEEKLDLPVVYDPESILDAEARTDDVSGEQFTKNTVAFTKAIKDAGYEPMVYSNMLWEAFELDLKELPDIPIWYADYEPLPQTPYDFTMWQYSNEGNVKGISGVVDLDIQLFAKDNFNE